MDIWKLRLRNEGDILNIRDQILQLISEFPKHYSRKISANIDLLQWVETNTLSTSDNIADKIYSAITQQTNVCKRGNTYKFSSFKDGYKFCGRASSCECARESVSKNVSKTKQAFSEDIKNAIKAKTSQTCIERYGVANTGQTDHAKQRHAEFYTNEQNILNATNKSKQTKLRRYGDENYNNPVAIKNTWKKMRTDFWQDYYDDKNLSALHDKDILSDLYNSMSVADIASKLNVHPQTVYKHLNTNDIRTPYQSSYEKEIVRFLTDIGVTNIITNSRSVLPSHRELDIYLPDYNLAIEFNGIYWHHEDIPHIHRSYHRQKFIEAENLGIQLITIFSNFWNTKKEIVKRSLISKLGVSNDKIYGRHTIAKKIEAKDTKDFLNANHIQGYASAPICYGLFHENELVAVMTFSNRRIAIGTDNDDMELVRYSTSTHVVGGAGKLLSAFKRDHPDTIIYSYSNNEWSNGNLYKTLGFVLDNDIDSSYWYIHPKEEKLLHRFNFSKQKLVEKGYSKDKSEREICREMGLLRVWDCGKRKWKLYP